MMFPIRDHNPSGRTPFVTYGLIAANVAVFIAMLQAFGDPWAIDRIYAHWAMIPLRISAGQGYYTLVTSMFMHAGLIHILGNILFLWVFGDNLEDQLGPVAYLGFYLVSGVAAAGTQYLGDPTSTTAMVGASGAIAGVMGGYLCLFPKARVDVLVVLIVLFRVITAPAFLVLGLWFGLQILFGAESVGGGGGVAYLAHIGGFVTGIALTLPFLARHGGTAFWRRNQGLPPHPATVYRLRRTTIPKVRR